MIRLTEDYSIDIDGYNYILYKDSGKVNKDGNPVRRSLGYFGTLKELLNCWAEIVVKSALNERDTLLLSEAVEVIGQELSEVKKTISDAIPDISVYPDKA